MWNPEQYNKFNDHRTRPATDLINAIPNLQYESIVDLGCGSGHITQMLYTKFLPKYLTGIDNSEAMLTKARTDFPQLNWQLEDISHLSNLPKSQDLIFSTSALQWINNHEQLFNHLIQRTNKVMAIQMPSNFRFPAHALLRDTIQENKYFKIKLQNIVDKKPVIREEPVFTPDKYYAILNHQVTTVDIWETTYLQQLTGENPVLEWVKGTALLPVEEHLSPDEFIEFKAIYNEKLLRAYPQESNGITLFPFSRIFIVATK